MMERVLEGVAVYEPGELEREQFEEQLRRIVTRLGGPRRAAEKLQLSEKTLGRWLKKPPGRNYTDNLKRTDAIAAREIPGYPAGAGGGKALHELAVGWPAPPPERVDPPPDLVRAEESSSSRRAAALSAGIVAGAVIVALLVGWWVLEGRQDGDAEPDPTTTSAATGSSTSAGEVVPGTLPPQPGLTVEVAAGRTGVPVYGDATGAAVPAQARARIPYGTAVYIRCKEPNRSGITSVAFFYRVVGGEWDGLVAVSNGFQNGDEFGISGGRVVNETIPDCR